MKIYIQSIIVLLALLVTGCAHQIEINPDMANINQAENKSEKIVGYYISDENKKKKVTSPGGGGDKITYLPYSDLESAFYTALSSKYKDVYSVKSLDVKQSMQMVSWFGKKQSSRLVMQSSMNLKVTFHFLPVALQSKQLIYLLKSSTTLLNNTGRFI